MNMASVQDIQQLATVTMIASSVKTAAVILPIYVLKVVSPNFSEVLLVYYLPFNLFSARDLFILLHTGSPRAPTDVTVSSMTAVSAVIRWTIPFIASTQETYVVTYGLDPNSLTAMTTPITSGPNVSSVYTQVLSNLDPLETYYLRVVAANDAGSAGSDIYSFMTLEGRKFSNCY